MDGKQNAWKRGQATVKIVGRRKQLLEAIARAHAPGCSPIEAIDRALELATRPSDETDYESRFYAIEDILTLIEDARRHDTAALQAQLAKVVASLAGLHALIKELAEAG